MKVNEAGVSLVKRYEGCRVHAYQDCVGVWTIGYGHTSHAGPPPVVPNMSITQAQADSILQTDLDTFSVGVRDCIRVSLNDNQFSALLSFAYNVALGNFGKSSVLAAVNVLDFEAVPRRLALWVKAGGKVVPGLVARRGAEGALFMTPDSFASVSAESAATPAVTEIASTTLTQAEPPPVQTSETGDNRVQPIAGKLSQNSTVMAAAASGTSGVISTLARHLQEEIGEKSSLAIEIAAVTIIVLSAIWIIRKRRTMAVADGA